MANFNFKSPSVKFQEIDRSFASTPSLGITSVGMVGETLKGPAFSPVLVTTKSEFRRYFGGTSTEKYADGSGKMKFLAPTYANSFLEEGNQLYFTRILGKSGYNAGPGWAIRVGAPVINTALTATEISGSVSISTSTFLGIDISGGDGDYNNLPLTYDKTNLVATAQTVYLTISGYSPSSSTVNTATSAVTSSDSGFLNYTGTTLYGISLVSATAATGTSLNNLPLTWAYDSTNGVYTGLTAYLVVSGYVSSSLTSSINYNISAYSANEIVTPASGVASYTAFTYTAQTTAYENMVVAILRSRGDGLQNSVNYKVSSVTGTFTNTVGSPLSNFTITAVGTTTEVFSELSKLTQSP